MLKRGSGARALRFPDARSPFPGVTHVPLPATTCRRRHVSRGGGALLRPQGPGRSHHHRPSDDGRRLQIAGVLFTIVVIVPLHGLLLRSPHRVPQATQVAVGRKHVAAAISWIVSGARAFFGLRPKSASTSGELPKASASRTPLYADMVLRRDGAWVFQTASFALVAAFATFTADSRSRIVWRDDSICAGVYVPPPNASELAVEKCFFVPAINCVARDVSLTLVIAHLDIPPFRSVLSIEASVAGHHARLHRPHQGVASRGQIPAIHFSGAPSIYASGLPASASRTSTRNGQHIA